MVTVTTDELLRALLGTMKEETLIRDAEGRLLGRFIPCGLTDDEVYARAGEYIDLEEAKRRKISERGQGTPLGEVLARVQAAGNDPCATR